MLYTFAMPLVIIVLTGGAAAVVGAEAVGALNIVITLVAGVGVAAIANALYARKVRALVAKSEKVSSDAQVRRAWLAKNGGTSWIVAVLLGVMLVGMLAAIALPAYNDYVERATQASGG